jgi:molybdate transport system ATP-binding protein
MECGGLPPLSGRELAPAEASFGEERRRQATVLHMSKIALEASLAKRFSAGGFSLDVTLRCEPGVTVLFGASGAGKTLTLNLLAGLTAPDRGRVLLGDELLCDAHRNLHVPPRRRGIGYVFQSETLFPHMTVAENMVFPLAKVPPLERRRRVNHLLEVFRISGLAGRMPRELSGGERQRVTLARALAADPRLLLLDEPARGLDYELRHDLYAVLRQVREQYPIPIVVVTHDLPEAFLLAGNMYIYQQGRVAQEGAPDAVYAAPRTAQVARLLGYTNIFEGVIEHLDPAAGVSHLRCAGLLLTAGYLPGRLRGDRVGFCIPAAAVKPGGGEGNRLRGERTHQILSPSTARLFFRLENSPLELECEVPRESAGAAGSQSALIVPPSSIHVFPAPSGNRE